MKPENFEELQDLIHQGKVVQLFGYSASSIAELNKVVDYPAVQFALNASNKATEPVKVKPAAGVKKATEPVIVPAVVGESGPEVVTVALNPVAVAGTDFEADATGTVSDSSEPIEEDATDSKEAGATGEVAPDDLEKMGYPALKALATEMKIDLKPNPKKDDVKRLIREKRSTVSE